MFSGLIARRGEVLSLDVLPAGGARLRVRCEGVDDERPQEKDSIAIDGVCLTVTAIDGGAIAFDVVPETMARTTLGARKPHDAVNVEYSLRLGDRMGGHFVYGHVDAAPLVAGVVGEGEGARMRIESPAALAPMLPEKAFVAVDGVSVTIAAAGNGWFEIALIPETLARTTLGARIAGDAVNVEVDPIARYAYAATRA
jgi:riboflavin synthase alpha subunit